MTYYRPGLQFVARLASPTVGGMPLETALLEAYDSPFIERITLDQDLKATAVLVDGSRVKLEGLDEEADHA